MTELLGGVSVIHLTRPFAFESPFRGDEFALLLVIAAPDVSADEQKGLSQAIVLQGCRYAVCTGVAASDWDDAIDFASVDAGLSGQQPSDRLIMTTWHENEPLHEVARFFFKHTAFEDFVPSRRVALLVGGADEELRALRGALEEARGGPTRS